LTVKVEVGRKGYIIIPKSIRELVGIKEGDVLTLTVENGRIVLEPERKLASSSP
jgi:AbrB family looped-hinge helix DNA binding protein